MPLLLEDDPRSGPAGFDLSTATTLFWKNVPVHLKQHDREDVHEELTFRILTGVGRQNHNLRILRIHISSESDLFFLHTLEVSEEDFQSLKNEQGILVDFASFPGKIISLLERCIAAQPGDSPRFQAVMGVRGGESVFKIVEINDFKQLPHITLAFRPGNDAVVKQFLAFRLTEVKADCQELAEGLGRTKEERDTTVVQLAECRQQFAELREQHDKRLLEMQAYTKTQQASAHEERLRERAELKDQYERERAELERRLRDHIAAQDGRLAELDTENRKLREIKYELDTKVSELSHKLGTAEGSNRSLDEEGTRLRSAHQSASAAKHELEILLNEARAKVLALEEKAQSQADVIDQQRGRLRDMEAAMRQAEQRCSDLREAASSAEARFKEAQAEVLKGNSIIEKLTTDLKLAKEKTKRKTAIIVRQEEELQQREQALGAVMRDFSTLGQQADAMRSEISNLQADNEALRGKLEDSKQQLLSNEQMIRWLNQQVTDAQLHASGAVVPGSRYSFRPTTSALPSAAPAPSVAATPAVGLLAGPGPSTTYKPVATASRYLSSGTTGLGTGAGPASGLGLQNNAGGATSGGGGGYAGGAGASTSSGGGPGMGGAGAGLQSSYRGLAAAGGAQPSPGFSGGAYTSTVTPSLHRVSAGLGSSSSTYTSSLSLTGGFGGPARAVDATPAPSKYGLNAVGFGAGAGGGASLGSAGGFGLQSGASVAADAAGQRA